MKKVITVRIGKTPTQATFVESCSLNTDKATHQEIKNGLLKQYDGFVRKRGKSFFFYYGYRLKA